MGLVMQMNRQDNICKFITHTSTDRITTTNFVYEKRAENREAMTVSKNYAIYLVVSGKGILRTETFVKELQPGNLFFTFVQVPFKIENTNQLQYMYISFHGGRSEELFARFGIATRPGAHCAPLLHDALGTGRQGAVRFSFSHFNTLEEIKIAVSALRELAQEE